MDPRQIAEMELAFLVSYISPHPNWFIVILALTYPFMVVTTHTLPTLASKAGDMANGRTVQVDNIGPQKPYLWTFHHLMIAI